MRTERARCHPRAAVTGRGPPCEPRARRVDIDQSLYVVGSRGTRASQIVVVDHTREGGGPAGARDPAWTSGRGGRGSTSIVTGPPGADGSYRCISELQRGGPSDTRLTWGMPVRSGKIYIGVIFGGEKISTTTRIGVVVYIRDRIITPTSTTYLHNRPTTRQLRRAPPPGAPTSLTTGKKYHGRQTPAAPPTTTPSTHPDDAPHCSIIAIVIDPTVMDYQLPPHR